jgi:peptide/nickel transport system permease protein
MTQAVTKRDYPVVEASFLLLALVVLTANLIIDLLGSVIDPRTRGE